MESFMWKNTARLGRSGGKPLNFLAVIDKLFTFI